MNIGFRMSALFCAGFGASVAWWLVMSTNLAAQVVLPMDPMLVIHVCYFAVLLICALAARRFEPWLRSRIVVAALSTATVLLLAISVFALIGYAPLTAYLSCIVLASVAKAFLFLAWMLVFCFFARRSNGFALMLASMTAGWVLCLIAASVPMPVTLVLTCALPAMSGACLVALLTLIRREGGAGPSSQKPAKLSSRLFPPLFVLGLALYEFAPGFVTGTLHADDSFETLIGTYAFVTLFLSCALVALALLSRVNAWKSVQRFVVPLIAVGLLAIPLLNASEQAFAFACVIAGTSLFDVFVYASFARVSQKPGASPLRVFATGQLIIQTAILAAYLLGMALAGQAATWISAVCLLLVFLFILGGRFDLHDRDALAAAESDEPLSDRRAVETAAFAQAFGYSKREAEILELVTRGRNAPAIAEELVIAPSTVKTHLAHMYQKAGVGGRQELLRKLDDFGAE